MLNHARQPWAEIPPNGPIIRTTEAAEYLGLSIAQFYALANRGVLPKALKIGPRASGVPRAWLDAIIADRASRAARVA